MLAMEIIKINSTGLKSWKSNEHVWDTVEGGAHKIQTFWE